MSHPPQPLDGVKVVDIANFLAGPIASMFLADFGADVVKVERPGTGDELRFWGNDKDWDAAVTSKGCIPVNENFFDKRVGFINRQFFDVVLGISDPNVFIPPATCA